MDKFSVVRTVHLGMVVEDLNWTALFFEEIFGFELIDRSPRTIKNQSFITGIAGAEADVAYMQSPGLLLEIVQYSNPPGLNHHRPEMAEIGHFHICLLVDNVSAAITACQSYDTRISFLSPTPMEVDNGPNKGNKVIVMRLPDGVMVELISSAQKSFNE